LTHSPRSLLTSATADHDDHDEDDLPRTPPVSVADDDGDIEHHMPNRLSAHQVITCPICRADCGVPENKKVNNVRAFLFETKMRFFVFFCVLRL
jgi:hypothetical protein